MSNSIRRFQKRSKKLQERIRRTKSTYTPPKRYKSFNIFTRDGKNLTVTSDQWMTLEEAQYHYKALSISGNE